MAAQQGFQYEVNAANFLKPLGIVPKGFTPAGASHDQPDLMLEHKGKQAGCELKITDASAGSLVLKYDFTKKRTPWGFNEIDPNDEEKVFLRDLAIRTGALTAINRQWKDVPAKGNPLGKKMDKEKMYRRDLGAFPDIKQDIPAAEIEAYYNQKKTYYVNIGTHGLFLFGTKDPLGLNKNTTKSKSPKVETFGQSARAWYRARVQYKGSGNYQFTFELQFKVQKKSEYNIAPITKGSVTILKDAAALHCFI
jgi:hypothetical protein